jgi:hypothetical protein
MGVDDRDWMIKRTKERFTKQTNDGKELPLNGKTIKNKKLIKIYVAIFLFSVLYSLLGNHGVSKVNFDSLRISKAPFPVTDDVRWFTTHSYKDDKQTGRLEITGLNDPSKNSVVRLDDWETHQPVVLIPIRGNEVAVLNIPFGRYRVIYTEDAVWRSDFSLADNSREIIDPMDFYLEDNRIVGHTLNLNGRINGNVRTKNPNGPW